MHSKLDFTNPDFEKLAQSFGAWGQTLTAPDQLSAVLNTAFRRQGPALIAIPIDYAENLKITKRLGEPAFTI